MAVPVVTRLGDRAVAPVPGGERWGSSVDVQGTVAAGFERVEEAFRANFEAHGDVGAATAVYVHGEKVVDLWGGVADAHDDRPWEEGTLALVYSTTKGVTAILAHLLAQRGLLDLDAPVTDHWPEFGAEGKGGLTLREVMGHRAGLPALDDPVPVADVLGWDPMVERLAAQKPLWSPGTSHGYHALTYGWLVGEVLRRVTGRSVSQLVADELSGPLGLELWIGLPEAEEHRVSRLVQAPPAEPLPADAMAELPPEVLAMVRAMSDPSSLTMRALSVTDEPLNYNSREVHEAQLPAANGIGTARSLARLYAATVGEVDGVRLLEDATVADATREVSNGPDEVLLVPTRFGAGFFLSSSFSPLMGPRSFGHAGAGGSLAFADPDAGVGFAYVMNQMSQNISNDLRTSTLIDAVKASL
jgi:CubicO group peptidase (beta-lactamase class C family)